MLNDALNELRDEAQLAAPEPPLSLKSEMLRGRPLVPRAAQQLELINGILIVPSICQARCFAGSPP